MTNSVKPPAGSVCGCHLGPVGPEGTARWLTPEQVVAYVHGAVSLGTLRNYRSARIGPRYLKVGRSVFYTVDSVQEWLTELAREDDLRWNDSL